MNKIKTVVFTKRTTPPLSIKQGIEAATVLTPIYHAPALSSKSVSAILSYEKPAAVVIDGHYGPGDKAMWIEMNRLGVKGLRLRLLDKLNTIPDSLELLRITHAIKEDGTNIAIFLDQPSDAVVEEVKRLGANIVWPTLERISPEGASFYEVISSGKEIIRGVQTLTASAKKFFDFADPVAANKDARTPY